MIQTGCNKNICLFLLLHNVRTTNKYSFSDLDLVYKHDVNNG